MIRGIGLASPHLLQEDAVAEGAAGGDRAAKLLKCVYAAGCNLGAGREPGKGVTKLSVAKSALPKGSAFTFAVRPLSSLGTAGRPITAKLGA